jgi:hypothetical protein
LLADIHAVETRRNSPAQMDTLADVPVSRARLRITY